MSRNERILRLFLPLLFSLASAALLIYIQATKTQRRFEGPSPMSFPRVILWLILILSVAELILEFYRLAKAGGWKGITGKGLSIVPIPALIAVVTLVVYVLLWNVIGFTLSTAIYVGGVGKYLRKKRPIWECALVGIGFALLMYFLFVRLFAVMLPDPLVDLILYGR